MKPVLKKLAAVAVLAGMAISAHADIGLKASHQFPGGKGDVRDVMAQIIARSKGRKCRLDHQGVPRLKLGKTERAVESHAQRSNRHDVAAVGLRFRFPDRIWRDADARSREEPRTRAQDQRIAFYG